MIASQKIGKSFMGALKYNWNKLVHPDPNLRAKLLSTNFTSMNLAMIKREVDLVRSLRPTLGRYVYHTSLNFHKDDVLDNETLLAIAEDYLRLSGYISNQYFIFRHQDAEHPHLHLLVNRITFDGEVVSDSNNYKRSDAIAVQLEHQYNLVKVKHRIHAPVEQDSKVTEFQSNRVSVEQGSGIITEQGNPVPLSRYNKAPLRAPTKSELEMVIRTHKGSDKMVLQDKLLRLVSKPGITLKDLINKCEAEGIHLLINQASTGRVSGITYFHGDFKIKGQALGNRFKWAELIKTVNYEQGRDGQAIRQANERTRGKYRDYTGTSLAASTSGLDNNGKTTTANPAKSHGPTQKAASGGRDATQSGEAAYGNGTGAEGPAQSLQKNAEVDNDNDSYGHCRDYGVGYIPDIEISDDIDDEAILGKNRRRQKQARTNRR